MALDRPHHVLLAAALVATHQQALEVARHAQWASSKDQPVREDVMAVLRVSFRDQQAKLVAALVQRVNSVQAAQAHVQRSVRVRNCHI